MNHIFTKILIFWFYISSILSWFLTYFDMIIWRTVHEPYWKQIIFNLLMWKTIIIVTFSNWFIYFNMVHERFFKLYMYLTWTQSHIDCVSQNGPFITTLLLIHCIPYTTWNNHTPTTTTLLQSLTMSSIEMRSSKNKHTHTHTHTHTI